MAAVVVTAQDYLRHPADIEAQGPFRWRLLAEGDSWLDRSTPTAGSLPQFLAQTLHQRGQSALVINLSSGGHTLRRITQAMNGSLAWWLEQFTYDAIVFSAGGNDLIDAALSPPPGQGILIPQAHLPVARNASACIRASALQQLLDGYLAFNFATIHHAIRAGRNRATPVLLNSYDTPTARPAPAFPGVGPWLCRAYAQHQIAPALWRELTQQLFTSLRQAIDRWTEGRPLVFAVPTSGVLQPAAPDSVGDSGDWANEIHPNAAGWKKLAPVWADALQALP